MEKSRRTTASVLQTVPVIFAVLSLYWAVKQRNMQDFWHQLPEDAKTRKSTSIIAAINGSGCASLFDLDANESAESIASYFTKIEICQHRNSSHAFIAIQTREILPLAVFRLRMVGPEINLVKVSYLADKLHYGRYKVGAPGKYYFELMILYTYFDENNIRNSSEFIGATSLTSVSPLVVSYDDFSEVGKENHEYRETADKWIMDTK